MSRLPDYEPNLIPEGNYLFTVAEEPEVRKKTNPETNRVTKRVIFKLEVEGMGFILIQSFFPWLNPYRDLAAVFGAPVDEKTGVVRMSMIEQFTGLQFQGDLVHDKDAEKDKTYMRIQNVSEPRPARKEESPEPSDPDDEEAVPF